MQPEDVYFKSTVVILRNTFCVYITYSYELFRFFQAIKNGDVYVLRYEVFDDMVSYPDLYENRPGRTMWLSQSPVALFAVNKEKQLRAAAIQTDYKPGWTHRQTYRKLPLISPGLIQLRKGLKMGL